MHYITDQMNLVVLIFLPLFFLLPLVLVVVLVVLLVIFLLFTALVLPKGSSQAALETNASGSPDLSLFYSVDKLYQMADAYGETGRDAYIRARFTFDLIWPLVYTLFLATAISWVYQMAFTPERMSPNGCFTTV